MKNKVAVVTGAASGIGRAVALALSKEGVSLALLDIDCEKLKETAGILQTSGGNTTVKCYRTDIADNQMVTQVCEEVIQDFGRTDILINNAGVASSGYFKDLGLETFT